MPYIGNTNTTQAFTPAVDFFNGNGSTTAFTLSRPVASVAQVQAVIENVPQKPGDAFTVSGNTITFTSAPPSGTQNIYVYYTSPITQVIAPGQGTVGTTALLDASVTAAKLASGAARSNFGAGAVLQVAQARKTDTYSNSTSSFAEITGMTVTMTPANASSKFLVYVDLFVGANWWSTNGGYLGVLANGTLIAGNGGALWALQYGADSGLSPYETLQWTDSVLVSPFTSFPITFSAVIASGSGGTPIYINRAYNNFFGTQGRSVLTVMEIAG